MHNIYYLGLSGERSLPFGLLVYICETKGADQLIRTFVFATWIVLSLYFLSQKPSSVVVQPGLCWTWSETPKTVMRLK